MPETVLITIFYDGAQADFELPSKLPIGVWADSLRDALKMSFRGMRLENKKVFLSLDGEKIPYEATFEECGIFDGRKLQLHLEEM